MRTLVFAPVTFNLAETTRMIVIARAMGPGWRCVFQVYEDDDVHLIAEAGFEFRHLGPVFSRQERAQVLAFDQGRSIRHPFTTELVRMRVTARPRDVGTQRFREAVHRVLHDASVRAAADRVQCQFADEDGPAAAAREIAAALG